MADRGRLTVEREYDWSMLSTRLGKIWNDCVDPQVARGVNREERGGVLRGV